MAMLVNAYATLREPPPLEFPHQLRGRRDLSDPDLSEHLSGFAGWIASRREEMTAVAFHAIGHVRRVRQHLSLEVEEAHLDALAAWGWAANALLFLPDGTLRDPSGRVLVDHEGGDPDDEAQLPYPEDACQRAEATCERLSGLGVPVIGHLPPGPGLGEVLLRAPAEVARRALALFAVAVRGESLGGDEPIALAELRERLPAAWAALTPWERAFLDQEDPPRQEVLDATWRYEALAVLLWSLEALPELPFPRALCDVPRLARLCLADPARLVDEARLRPAAAILDALDEHYRLHWAVRQARLDGVKPAADLEPGVVAERHHALNWLTRFDEAEWDEVETPT